jgi:hypothetical protein
MHFIDEMKDTARKTVKPMAGICLGIVGYFAANFGTEAQAEKLANASLDEKDSTRQEQLMQQAQNWADMHSAISPYDAELVLTGDGNGYALLPVKTPAKHTPTP